MSRASPTLATLALFLAPLPGIASTPALESLFPNQADLFVDEEGLARLVLPPEVLASCRADLSDLRVFSASGEEVPFLVDSGIPPEVALEARQSFRPDILAVEQETVEREGAPNLNRERYELSLPPEESETGAWDLSVISRRRRFVRRIDVAIVAADGTAKGLVVDGSVFRLSDPLREKTRLTLPAFAGERLEVRLEGEEGFNLEPEFRFQSAREIPGRERASVALQVLEIRALDRRTEVELGRPRGLVPDLLVLETATGSFARAVEVWDEGPGSGADSLGKDILFRVEAPTAVEGLELQIRPARGDRLRVVIDDGDSPPLDAIRILAAVRRPALIFSLEAGTEGAPAGRLLFGGGRAYRPRYDLAALAPDLARGAQGDAARLAGELYDPDSLAEVRLGALAPNVEFDAAPALEFAMRPGAVFV